MKHSYLDMNIFVHTLICMYVNLMRLDRHFIRERNQFNKKWQNHINSRAVFLTFNDAEVQQCHSHFSVLFQGNLESAIKFS